jgi:hypothetical protein
MPAKFATLMTLAIAFPASAEYFTIGPVPSTAPLGFSQLFTKHIEVMGLHVYASSTTQNSKMLHAANILAQWVDNDEDCEPDDAAVSATMQSMHASMLMWQNESSFENSGAENIIPESVWDSTVLQLLFGDETNPGYPGNQEFDWSLEECLHLVTFGGYAITYPNTWGESHGTAVADAMDICISGGWYHYDDPTCDYACKITEYHYWALTSLLGGQNYPWRIPEIANEWELPTAALLQQHNPTMAAMLSDPQWSQASVLPDGTYDPQPNECPGDFDGDGMVGANDLLAILAAWGSSDADMDLNGDGVVGVTDLLNFLEYWGDC